MATYTVLHGAKENAGDFLIRDAAIKLLEHLTGVGEDNMYLVDIVRNKLSTSQLDKIRATEVAFLAGGPGYQRDFYPGTYPSMKDVLDATTVVPLGPGWKGQEEEDYRFTDESLHILRRMADQAAMPFLGARDLPSVRVLQKHDLPAKLTGCPAWYFHEGYPPQPRFTADGSIQRILISTPPQNNPRLLIQYLLLLRALKKRYKSAERICMFHRGEYKSSFKPKVGYPWRRSTWKKNITPILYDIIVGYAKKTGFDLLDISGSSEYAKEYAEADLHVGYRVHAHIPSITAGTPSFLLQIDGRGKGVSESLGTDADIWARGGIKSPIDQVLNSIEDQMGNGLKAFRSVAANMAQGYENMVELISGAT